MQELSDAEAGRFLKSICMYAETGESASLSGPERILYKIALSQMRQDTERSAKISGARAEAGRVGGLKSKKAEANESKISNCLKAEANESKISNCSIKNKELRIKNSEREKEKESIEISASAEISKRAKEKPQKHKYGQFQNVLLTDDEHSKLRERFLDAEQRIENFSSAKAAKGYTYKSDYAAILNWARNEAEKNQQYRHSVTQKSESWTEIAARIAAEEVTI